MVLTARLDTINLVNAIREVGKYLAREQHKIVAGMLDGARELIRSNGLKALIDKHD